MVSLEFYQIALFAVLVGLIQVLANYVRSVQRIKTLEMQVIALEQKVTLLESAHLSSPLPMWIKDVNFVMRSFNQAYIDTFLRPRGIKESEYLHHFDDAVWPADIAKEYRENDMLVINTGKIQDIEETVIDHRGERYKMRIIKFPRKVGGMVIGIAGIAVPVRHTVGD